MSAKSKILFTGGSGLLGCEFRKILPDLQYPSSSEFDVTNLAQMKEYAAANPFETLVHAAAFTSPPVIDKDPLRALEVNIVGTSNVVKLCLEYDARLIYLSTDYVFSGDKGDYVETDPVLPVNRYAWSKLGGECAAMLYDKALIVRTSFGPEVFPFPKAFADQWTTREPVSVIAEKISKLLDVEATGVLHVAGKKRTVYEYAKSLDPDLEVGKLSVNEVDFSVPVDTSLNGEKYEKLLEKRSQGMSR